MLEAAAAGLAGVVVWGLHRDSAELREIRFPLSVTTDDVVFCDDDGVAFVGADRVQEVVSTARALWEIERCQAERIGAGKSIRDQTRFAEYLARRSSDSTYTFRAHLRAVRGAIEQ